MLNLQGNVTECAMSNLFAVSSGRVLTPPLSAGILDGITREHVLSLCQRACIPCSEEELTPEDLLAAAECFLTSTTRELLPVVEIDGRKLGSVRPGPLTHRLLTLFRASAMEAAGGHASG